MKPYCDGSPDPPEPLSDLEKRHLQDYYQRMPRGVDLSWLFDLFAMGMVGLIFLLAIHCAAKK